MQLSVPPPPLLWMRGVAHKWNFLQIYFIYAKEPKQFAYNLTHGVTQYMAAIIYSIHSTVLYGDVSSQYIYLFEKQQANVNSFSLVSTLKFRDLTILEPIKSVELGFP
ncbi:protocadherin Fat 4 [Platysternon megacephalum]|uniref:Protocadherin Fat 4 n=1 Tax=Platysternon megacephalum TaxID=55544 RepID=A0A4D9FAE7_9SAUR|nr:protocadherin Fat 4 [Platysternon megacephalum]